MSEWMTAKNGVSDVLSTDWCSLIEIEEEAK